MFDVKSFLHSDALGPAVEWKGYPKFNFIGGHNDNENIPVISLKESIDKVILREGKTLAKYGPGKWSSRISSTKNIFI